MKKKKVIFQIEIAVALILIIMLWLSSGYKISQLKSEAERGLSVKNQAMLSDAIVVFRGDNESRCPAQLEDILKEHLDKIPPSYTIGGVASSEVRNGSYNDMFDGRGGWIYVNDPYDKDYCKVFPNTN
jgi:hypothetical protein